VSSLPSTDAHEPRIGMCSVTLRAEAPGAVIERAVAAGLDSIEWGSDVHLPAGDLDLAEAMGRRTREAGLTVCSYGSYVGFPWARGVPERFDAVLETAQALGAPRIRVWAGPHGSEAADVDARTRATDDLREMVALAAAAGVEVAVEFHGGTLADTAASTRQLLTDLGGAASTYWQPRVGATDDEALGDLAALASDVSTVHVFSWGSSYDRHPLAWRRDLWTRALPRIASSPRITDLLLEFLPADDADLLPTEAAELRTWLADARTGATS
jgi:3-dehydroshikimate dehydratase